MNGHWYALRATALNTEHVGAIIQITTTMSGLLEQVEQFDGGSLVNVWDGELQVVTVLPTGRHILIDQTTAERLHQTRTGRIQLAQAREDVTANRLHRWSETGRHHAGQGRCD